MAKSHVSTTVNGDPVEFLCDTAETMLDVLRNTMGLTGTKEGCGTGDCGACSIIVDGREISRLSDVELVPVRRKFGMVFQMF